MSKKNWTESMLKLYLQRFPCSYSNKHNRRTLSKTNDVSWISPNKISLLH